MPVYTVPKSDVREVVDRVMEEHHPHLKDAGVTIGLLACWAGEDASEDEAASPLKLHGYPCLATVKINSLKDRVEGKADATITIDGAAWEDADDSERAALIDHELTHLTLAKDKEGHLKADDHGRPKLKMRLHDWQLGGFEEIVSRHGDAAPERQAWKAAEAKYHQVLMAWG